MKKFIYLTTIATLAFTPIAFANAPQANTNAKGYYSKQHPLTGSAFKAAAKGAMISPTDIIVNNATYNTITLNVVEGGFSDQVGYRGYDHIFNSYGAFNTKITFYDPANIPFFTATFCPRASITIYGYTPYDVVVDNESCKR